MNKSEMVKEIQDMQMAMNGDCQLTESLNNVPENLLIRFLTVFESQYDSFRVEKLIEEVS